MGRAEGDRQAGIDLLRAIAVSAVVLYHYTARYDAEFLRLTVDLPHATYGNLGVNLFFIVSGYCIALTLVRSKDVVTFWSRRFGRLEPAYLISACLTFLIVGWFGLPERELGALEGLGNLVGANLFGLVPHIDGAYWSLVVEVKFYILLGVLCWASAKDMRRVHLWWRLFCIAGFALMAAFGVCLHVRAFASLAPVLHGAATGVLIYPYAIYFLGGLAIFRWSDTSPVSRLTDALIIAFGVIVAREAGIAKIICLSFFPLCLMLMRAQRVRIPRPILFVGVVSYPLYLLHQNIGIVIIRESNALTHSALVRIALAMLVTGALASGLALYIEPYLRPFAESAFLRVCARLRSGAAHMRGQAVRAARQLGR